LPATSLGEALFIEFAVEYLTPLGLPLCEIGRMTSQRRFAGLLLHGVFNFYC
jgi:hypothetical protein